MWSKDEFSTWFIIWGTINPPLQQGTVTSRAVEFYRDILLTEIQVSMSWNGAIGITPYSWEIFTNMIAGKGSAFRIAPAGAPFDDKYWKGSASSDRVNVFRVWESFPAEQAMQFTGQLYTDTPVVNQLNADIYVNLFYKVKRFY